MQIDRRMMEKLLSMNDEQLGAVIKRIASEAGIDPAQLGLDAENIQNLRAAMGNANPEDLKRFQEIYDAYRNTRRRT